MNDLLQSPDFIRWMLVLLRITFVLGTAWVLHILLKNRSPQWKVLLWRATVVSVLIMPFVSPWLAGWGFKIGASRRNSRLPAPLVIVDQVSGSATESQGAAEKPSVATSIQGEFEVAEATADFEFKGNCGCERPRILCRYSRTNSVLWLCVCRGMPVIDDAGRDTAFESFSQALRPRK